MYKRTNANLSRCESWCQTAGNQTISLLENPKKFICADGKTNSDGRQVAIYLAMADAALPSSADLSVPKLNPALDEREEDEFQRGNAPLKYISLCDVYSATSPCVTSRGSKKVKAAARKPPQMNGHDQFKQPHPIAVNPTLTHVYFRRRTRKEREPSFFESFVHKLEELEADGGEHLERRIKRRKMGSDVGLGDRSDNITRNDVGESNISLSDSTEKNISSIVRKNKNTVSKISHCENRKRKNDVSESDLENSMATGTKNWVWLSFEGVHPEKFIGLHCKVYWPLDASWYSGHIVGYNPETGRHHVKYEDEEEENLILSNERIKFHVSFEDTQRLKLKSHNKKPDSDGIDVDEMMALAASLDDCQEIEIGDVIWAKLTGHAVWPAIVLDESQVGQHKGLKKLSSEKSVLVQFFGTHDFARYHYRFVYDLFPSVDSWDSYWNIEIWVDIDETYYIGDAETSYFFPEGPRFIFSFKVQEANICSRIRRSKNLLLIELSVCRSFSFCPHSKDMFLTEHRLPKRMLQLRDGVDTDMDNGKSVDAEDNEGSGDDECMSHEEISKKLLDLKSCPLEDGELHIISLGKIVKDTCNFQDEKLKWPEGYTAVRMFPSITDPSVNALYKMEVLRDVDLRLRPLFRVTADNGEEFTGPTPSTCWNNIYKRIRTSQIRNRDYKADQSFASGSFMFGFSHSKVSKLIKPSNVKYLLQEYENNLFLQCDKCRMMVHARCYGELEPTGGILWLCNLCRPGAPESPPRCCLCPIVGGAMKPTTDGRWAHLACAIWIPETCLFDVKKMEPIDGLSRINKCSNNNCRVAYHPLCARVAGFCLEPEDKDRLHLIPFDEDEEDQCIQLLSFCKKHRPSSNERLPFDEQFGQKTSEKVEFIPPINLSGCARTEPLIFSKRRGRYDPEVPSASFKRLYVENQLYLIGGCSPRMPLWNATSSDKFGGSKYSTHLQKLQILQLEPSGKILSLADKYNYMRDTFRKRLAIGKSGIHGFGVFTKVPHRAGDMVIEYIGEIIRAPVADRREHLIYNSLVGAGTYMFRIDDERVIDATRAGSIAHLINHSCEPNCYSRVILVNGDDHIIIFAKRDIKQWEELTYDYRFLSTDERLVCSCGSSRCRVNCKTGKENNRGTLDFPSNMRNAFCWRICGEANNIMYLYSGEHCLALIQKGEGTTYYFLLSNSHHILETMYRTNKDLQFVL
ncbi:histone-lysine N-methyltransferase ATX1 [Striga asiatica]|uniref:Histone-lysine N-methyltransferase ATX1 n=1 Tax=Striga asiatica TaxID=4170 RepID=A0A5A7Q6D0_STRAF|nr:histone-lysine N-methyltransferase ATX1 [Striga asiatica]